MQRTIRITAEDKSGAKVIVGAKVTVPGLTMDEIAKVKSRLTRNLVAALEGVTFTDFGTDNTKVEV